MRFAEREFDVVYDPSELTTDTILQTISDLGFEPVVGAVPREELGGEGRSGREDDQPW